MLNAIKNKSIIEIVFVTVVVLISFLFMNACNSTMELSGNVIFSFDKEPIENATVRIDGQEVTTDKKGKFIFEQVSREEIKGSVEVSGFPDTDFSVEPTSNEGIVVEVKSAKLNIALSENANETKPIDGATVQLDGNKLDSLQIENPLPLGKHILEIESDIHEPYNQEIELTEGDNSIDIVLNITALETYKRYADAVIYKHHDIKYNYIHPDEKKKVSKKKFIKSETKESEVWEYLNVKFKQPRMLEKWTSKWLKKTYTNVADIDRTYELELISTEYSGFGKKYTDNSNQHWVQFDDGRWYLVHGEK